MRLMPETFPCSIRSIHNSILALSTIISSDTSENILSFSCIEVFSLFKWLKKSAKNNNFAVHSLSLNRPESSCFYSFKKTLTSLPRLATLSSTFSRDSQRMFKCYRSPLCSAPISSQNTQNKRLHKGRDFI